MTIKTVNVDNDALQCTIMSLLNSFAKLLLPLTHRMKGDVLLSDLS